MTKHCCRHISIRSFATTGMALYDVMTKVSHMNVSRLTILTTVIGYCGLMIVKSRTLLLPDRSSPLKSQTFDIKLTYKVIKTDTCG